MPYVFSGARQIQPHYFWRGVRGGTTPFSNHAQRRNALGVNYRPHRQSYTIAGLQAECM